MQQSDSEGPNNPDRNLKNCPDPLHPQRDKIWSPKCTPETFIPTSETCHSVFTGDNTKCFAQSSEKKKPRSFNSTPWHFKLDLFFCTRHLFAVTWRGGKTFYVCALLKKKKKKKSCYPCYVFSPSHRQCLTASCSSAADFTQFWQKKIPQNIII